MRIAAPEDGRVVADPLPPEVKRFINTHLHGFSQLELLLHLHDHPSEPVTAAIAARELRLGEQQAAGLLQDLHTRGLLATSDSEGRRESYRYEPSTRELARQVDALAEIYPTYRHRIVQLIFSKPPDSLTNFAQAFRLRKDEDG
jgi:hypothetical protein